MFSGFENKKIVVGDVAINCVIGGSGPPVLMLHGFPQNLSMWARVAPILSENFTIVCADLRGYGDSEKPKCLLDHSNYSFRTMAQDNVTLMQRLGFSSFHMVGHDRGGRTGHRMALDFPEAVQSLSVLDIVPTHTMFADTSRRVASAYWHWYFLSQPEPFPEHMIALDPDYFYETCLLGWGATQVEDFDIEQIDDYRRCWRDPAMIHGSCSDYRAAASIDLEHDEEKLDHLVECPTLVFFGEKGAMAECFDIPESWRAKCKNVHVATLPGGHFFVDVFPMETADILRNFLEGVMQNR